MAASLFKYGIVTLSMVRWEITMLASWSSLTFLHQWALWVVKVGISLPWLDLPLLTKSFHNNHGIGDLFRLDVDNVAKWNQFQLLLLGKFDLAVQQGRVHGECHLVCCYLVGFHGLVQVCQAVWSCRPGRPRIYATLAHMDFKRPGNMFPLARMAAWATMVTSSHKATDGLAKILTVTDVQKLKSQSSMAMTEEAELVLQDAWKTMGELIQAAEGPNQKAQESHYQKALESWQSGPCFSSAKSKSIPKKASLGPPCQKSLSNSPQIAEVQRPTKFLHLLSQKLKPVKSKIC